MSADLVSLRMLLVAATPPQEDLWRKGAAMASIPIDLTATDAAGAAGTLAGDGFDLCILEADLPDADKSALMAAAAMATAMATRTGRVSSGADIAVGAIIREPMYPVTGFTASRYPAGLAPRNSTGAPSAGSPVDDVSS